MKYLLPLLLMALNSPAWAQDENEDAKPEQERIYKVELIVFERLQEDKAFDAEQWPTNLQLAYPLNWERLVDPVLEEERIKRQLMEQERRDSLTLSDDFTQVFAGQKTQQQSADTEKTTEITQQDTQDASEQEQPNANTLKYYQFLSEEERELNTQEKSLARSRSLRTLFHQAWIQPMVERETAPALLIKGGNLYGAHYELEGSFTLSVARYLHLDTRLWLSEFVPNLGQSPENWFSLPQRPDSIFDSSEPVTLTDSLNSNASAITFKTELAAFDYGTEGNTLGQPFDFGLENQSREELPYLINQVISLEQKRRMRSGELHYLDHPRLGVLIKITPFEPAEAEKSAS